jgi:hypothetical protein
VILKLGCQNQVYLGQIVIIALSLVKMILFESKHISSDSRVICVLIFGYIMNIRVNHKKHFTGPLSVTEGYLLTGEVVVFFTGDL